MVEDGACAGTLDLYAIAPTLFDGDGDVDTGAMREAAAWMVGRGIADLLVTGSYGEFQSLADDERVEVVRAVRSVAGVRRVMACAACTSTTGTIELGKRLAGTGADLVMVAAPIAAEVSGEEVQRHFAAIAAGADCPLVVYNNPVFGMDLTVDDLVDVFERPQYRAVKQGTTSLRALTQSIRAVHDATGGLALVLAASDLTAVPALAAGADGLTSTNCWAFPVAIATLTGSAGAGSWERSRSVAAALEPYFSLVRLLGQPRTVKAAMTLRGLPGGGRVRAPYRPLAREERAELARVLEKCDAELAVLGVRDDGVAERRKERV